MSRNLRQLAVTKRAIMCFGDKEVASVPQRGLRLLEEALELAQACGVSIDMVDKVKDHVYSRPVGVITQEIGGVGVTLLVLASAMNVYADECEEAECIRLMEVPVEHFKARNKAKNDAGLIVPEVR